MISTHISKDLDSALIYDLLSDMHGSDQSLYDSDVATLATLRPNLLVTQALCNVCAVSGEDVARAVSAFAHDVGVVNPEPAGLDDVLGSSKIVAAAVNFADQGEEYVSKLQNRFDAIRVKSARLERLDRLRVILLAWLDASFDDGCWSPKIIHFTGGATYFGSVKAPSKRRTWVHFNEAMADTIAVALCGLNVDRSQRDVKSF